MGTTNITFKNKSYIVDKEIKTQKSKTTCITSEKQN